MVNTVVCLTAPGIWKFGLLSMGAELTLAKITFETASYNTPAWYLDEYARA